MLPSASTVEQPGQEGESWKSARQFPHSPTWFGGAGGELFFVLSGFLITGILFDSLGSERYFRNFYLRRTLRIFPLYYTVAGVCLLLTPFLHVGWNRYVVAMMLYVGNFTIAGAALGQHATPNILTIGGLPVAIGHFWSLCVEEQFYLIWPVVVFLVKDRRLLLNIAVGGVLFILGLRCTLFLIHSPSAPFLYFNSVARSDALLMGAAAALWLRGDHKRVALSSRVYAWMFFGPLLLLTSAILAFLHTRPGRMLQLDSSVFTTFGFSLVDVASLAALLAALDERTVVSRVLQARPLMALGVISYGVYVLHMLPLEVLTRCRLVGMNALQAAKFLTPLCMFPIVCAAAWLSWRFLESPFLRLKEQIAPSSKVRDARRSLKAAVRPVEDTSVHATV